MKRPKEPLMDDVDWRTRLWLALDARRALLLKIGLILSLFLLTFGVSVLTAWKSPLYGVALLALPFGAVFVLVLEKRLVLAPVIILFAAAFVPFSLPTGTGSRLVISLVLGVLFIFLWLLRMALVERHIHLERTPANAPVFGFIAVVIVSIVWSAVFRDPLVYLWRTFYFVQIASALVMIVSPALVLFSANVLREEKYIRLMVWLMIFLGAAGMVDNLLPISLPANTGGLASMWVIGLGLALGLFDEKMKKSTRAFLLLLALAWVYHGFVLNISWVAGWLPGLVAAMVILFLLSKRLFLAGVFILALYIVLNTGLIESWLGSEKEVSGDTRFTAWQINWKFTSQHFLFGMGPAGYAAYYMSYNPSEGMATHSNYIDILAQTGVVGMAFYLALFGVLAWRGWAVYRRVRGRRDFLEGLSVALLGGLAGCVVIMGFGDWLLPFAYTQTIMGFSYTVYSWLFLGLILSLDILTAREGAQEVPVSHA